MLGQIGQFARNPVVEVHKVGQDNVQIGINVMEETVKLETAIIIRVVIFYFRITLERRFYPSLFFKTYAAGRQ